MDTTIDTYCEECGEQEAYCFGGHAALCTDCFATQTREALSDAGLGIYCCELLRHRIRETPHEHHVLCLEELGAEHDHDYI